MQPFDIPYEVPERVSPECFIVGGRSYLTDRAVPLNEILFIPPRRFPKERSSLVFKGDVSTSVGHGGRRARLLGRLRAPIDLPRDDPYMDLRTFGVSNWSHALNNAIPAAIKARDQVHEAGGRNLSLVLPSPSPGRVIEFLRELGFPILTTNDRVRGSFVEFTPISGELIHGSSREWLSPHMSMIRSIAGRQSPDLPRRFFLDRRKGRHLLNGDAVRQELLRRGFVTVYPEDLSLQDQLSLFMGAEDIVAIHGAGLAPILYRTPEDGPFRFVARRDD